MKDQYFARLNQLTDSRFWINNPTPAEAGQAVSAGAVACTTNPTYGWKQLQHQSTHEEVTGYLDEAIAATSDDHEAADLVQQRCVKRILPFFVDLNKQSNGAIGFVSIQGNPFKDGDPQNIVQESHRYFELGPNVIAKIPVTRAGLEAIEQLVAEDVPIIATEVMSLSQAIHAAEVYQRVTTASGKRPPFFLTNITGIFDQYVGEEAARTGVEIHPDILFQAGTILARRQYHELKRRGFRDITMLGGGARGTHHFTELVGPDVHITINWEPTAKALLEADQPVVFRMDTPAPEFMVNELLEKIPAFGRAYAADGLSVDEFGSFGPVELFRSMFCDGWTHLVEAIRSRRADR